MIIRIIAIILMLLAGGTAARADGTIYYVSPEGNDDNPGTKKLPFATWEKARNSVRNLSKAGNITVYFRGGTYYLSSSLSFGPEDSGNRDYPVVYAAYPGEAAVISGAFKLIKPVWAPWNGSVVQTDVPGNLDFDQLFVNGSRRVRARFPDFDYKDPLRSGKGYQQVLDGSNKRYDTWLQYDSAIFSKKQWCEPTTGIVHAFQSHNWGNLQYRVAGRDTAANKILLGEGGWQLQRQFGIGKGRGSSSPFYVENIIEELDQPGEWFYDRKVKKLYYYPYPGEKLSGALIELVIKKNLMSIRGAANRPVSHIQVKGLSFTHSKTTFLENYEPLARGDWSIHRDGSVFLENTEDVVIQDCDFGYLGGNAVFVSKYNRRVKITGCRFYHTGESAVCFLGDTAAVKSYVTWDDKELYGKSWGLENIRRDLRPGPDTPDYPSDCVVENCIASELGDYGKQIAGVFISMSARIKVSHCTIFNVPRAAICINDGTWGGHIIEHCDIHETVRETGEHGPFNAWGRERFWLGPWGGDKMIKEYVLLDAVEPTVIRNNRIANMRRSVSAGNWTIDLDDGSSNYHIYNNLSLGSTLKLRDGFFRKVWNNITVGPVPLGWHVWPEDSGDEFYQNINVVAGTVPGEKEPTAYFIKPIRMPVKTSWGRVDSNLYYNANTPDSRITPDQTYADWKQHGYDIHSAFEDPLFVDPQNGNYQVRQSSAALGLGFVNFPMDQFGHSMTRAIPYGKPFNKDLQVQLLQDERGGDVRYTLDGTEPTAHSSLYTGLLTIARSLTLRAQTFSAGLAVGFPAQEVYTKTNDNTEPSWLQVLLRKDDQLKRTAKDAAATVKNTNRWNGVVITDIKDGDLIDATGGFEQGVFVLEIKGESPGYRWGIRQYDIITAVNGAPITTIRELPVGKQSGNQIRSVTLIRGYQQIQLTIPDSKK